MLFPNCSDDDWIDKYPQLEIIKTECPHCKKLIQTNIPYISHKWIGLMAKCECGYDQLECKISRNCQSANH